MIKRNLLSSEMGSSLKGKIRVDPFSEGIEACAALWTSLLCMKRLDKQEIRGKRCRTCGD